MKSKPIRAEFEKVSPAPQSSFVWLRVAGNRFQAPYHYHPEIELTLVTKSQGIRFVGDSVERFKEGDLILLGENLPHVWLNSPDCRQSEAIVIQFSPRFLGQGWQEIPEMLGIRRLLEKARRGLCFPPRTSELLRNRLRGLEKLHGVSRVTEFLLILNELGRQKQTRFLCSLPYDAGRCQGHENRIHQVYRYLNENYQDTLLQSQVAKQLRLSPPAFARFFRKVTGKKFTQVVNEMRVEWACHLLRESDKTISEICYESGYKNLSNFNRQFQRLRQMTPRQYRDRVSDVTVSW
jgi:AraC-like DNA-binding protein